MESLESRWLLTGFVVTSALDSGPGTLRQAIMDANAHPGADLVSFAIAGAGIHRITSSSGMPAISDGLTIDGATQPGYAGSPLIELMNPAGIGGIGLETTGDGCLIKGLAIDGYNDNIKLTSAGNTVQASYLGLLADGTNVPDPTDLKKDPPRAIGVGILGDHNTIGGTTSAARNVISGNEWYGIAVGPATGTMITGNYIGTSVDGNGAMANFIGIAVGGNETTIGGTVAAARNVISGNNYGIIVGSGSVNGTFIQGNYIGMNAAGTAAVPNVTGIENRFFTNDLRIGGVGAAGNVIVGNTGAGINIGHVLDPKDPISLDNYALIEGNWIGVTPTGVTMGKGGAGIVSDVAVTIGDPTVAGAANHIAHNGGAGVLVYGGLGTQVRGNEIYDNAGPGIDLSFAGSSANDFKDVDTGANGLQNYPVISAGGVVDAATTAVSGSINSTPNTALTLDFYANPAGKSQRQRYLGSTAVVTDANGDAVFNLALSAGAIAGEFLTATATDGLGNTSEFSPPVAARRTGDVDGDGSVGFSDLVKVAQNYGRPAAGWDAGDLNADGKIDFADLVLVAQHYGASPALAPVAVFAEPDRSADAVISTPAKPVFSSAPPIQKPVSSAKPVARPAVGGNGAGR